MPKHHTEDYKITAVKYFLENDITYKNVCDIFKCNERSLKRWIERYKKEKSIKRHNRKSISYKIESLITIVKNKYNSFFTIIIMNYNNSLCVKNTYNCETMENILLYTILIDYDKTDNLSLTKNINNFHENINIFNK